MGPFISLLATTYGLPEKSVVLAARAMREAGWLTSGARGVNAPEMTETDMARLSIALLTGEPPSKVVSEFEFIRTLQTKADFPSLGFVQQTDLPEAHNLEEAVVALTRAAFDRDRVARFGTIALGRYFIAPQFSVAVDMSRRTAMIETADVSAEYVNLVGEAEADALRASRSVDYDTLMRIDELESRSISSDLGGEVVASRGMRVVRTITHREFELIAVAMRGEATGSISAIDDYSEPPDGSGR